jgi:preprotein translocase subunit SecY
MWLAELLTEKGIGNGASFLIFANILAGIPNGVVAFWSMLFPDPDLVTIVTIVVLLVAFALIIAFVVLVHEGERRIPVQYARKAAATSTRGGMQGTPYIPLKVNIAGVLSIIFAMSLIGFPGMLAGFFPNATFINNVASYVDFSNLHWAGETLYVILIFAFTHFYTSFAVNPIEMAEGLKKNGGFIPGIRPGKPTSDFIQVTVDRLSWIGACFYVPQMAHIAFGGTSLLIVTGVALEFVKQLESQLLMRHYKGFLE